MKKMNAKQMEAVKGGYAVLGLAVGMGLLMGAAYALATSDNDVESTGSGGEGSDDAPNGA